jgi:single-stranded-DNA-specific exonuclease
MESRGTNLHAAGTLSIDRWNGTERVQLRLTDVASAQLNGLS